VFTFTVRPDGGGPFQVKASTRDVLVWEKAGPNRSMAKLIEDLHLASVYQVAHIAARRQQLFDGSLDEFEKTCDLDIDKVLQVDEPDPTQQAP